MRASVFENAADLITTGRYLYCCSALLASSCSRNEERLFVKAHKHLFVDCPTRNGTLGEPTPKIQFLRATLLMEMALGLRAQGASED